MRDELGLVLLLLVLGSRKSPARGGSSKIPEGPPTEDNWIPPQPVLPPNPLEKK